MSPKKRKQVSAEDKYAAILKQRTLRRQMLRQSMLDQQNIVKSESNQRSTIVVQRQPELPLKNSLHIHLRSKPIHKPLNIKICVSKDGNAREIKAFEIRRRQDSSIVPKERSNNKHWPKVVCNNEMSVINSTYFLKDGATLPLTVDLSLPPDTPAVTSESPLTSNTPITTPSLSLPSAPPNEQSTSTPQHMPAPALAPPLPQEIAASDSSPNSTQGTFLAPKKRRLILSDNPPPIFKAPYRMQFGDLRSRITGFAQLTRFEDDAISLCPSTITENIEDDISIGSPPITSVISPSKKAEILNWVTSATTASSSNFSNSNSPESLMQNASDGLDRFNSSSISPKVMHTSEYVEIQSKDPSSNTRLSLNNSLAPEIKNSPISSQSSGSTVTEPAPQLVRPSTSPRNIQPWIVPPIHHENLADVDLNNEIKRSTSLINVQNNTSLSLENNETYHPPFDSQKRLIWSSDDMKNSTPNELSEPNFTEKIKMSSSVDTKNLVEPGLSQGTLDALRSQGFEEFALVNHQKINSLLEDHHGEMQEQYNKRSGESTSCPNQNLINESANCQTTMTNERSFSENLNSQRTTNEWQASNEAPTMAYNKSGWQRMSSQRPIHQNSYGASSELIPSETENLPRPNIEQPRPLNESTFQGPPPVYVATVRNQRSPFNGPFPNRLGPRFPIVRRPPPNYKNRFPFLSRNSSLMEIRPKNHLQQRFISPRSNSSYFKEEEPSKPMQLLQIMEYLRKLCSHHHRNDNCRYGQACEKQHVCSEEGKRAIASLKADDLREFARKLRKIDFYRFVSENLNMFLSCYVLYKNKIGILELVHHILEWDESRCAKMHEVLQALSQLNMNYNEAVLKVLSYVGFSNRKLVDILFSLTIEHFTPTSWPAITELLDCASDIDHGVFSELCTKCLMYPNMGNIITALALTLVADPCKVDVPRLETGLVGRLCVRLDQIGVCRVAAELRSRWPPPMWARDAVTTGLGGSNNDPQLPTISSTIPGPSKQNFSPVSHDIKPLTSNAIHVNVQHARSTERNKNSCSPDSSSYTTADSVGNVPTLTYTSFSSPPPLLPPLTFSSLPPVVLTTFSSPPPTLPTKFPPKLQTTQSHTRNAKNKVSDHPKNEEFLPIYEGRNNVKTSESSSYLKNERYGGNRDNGGYLYRCTAENVLFSNNQESATRGSLPFQEESSGYSSENSSLLPYRSLKNKGRHLNERNKTPEEPHKQTFPASLTLGERYSPTTIFPCFSPQANYSSKSSTTSSIEYNPSMEMSPVSSKNGQNSSSEHLQLMLPNERTTATVSTPFVYALLSASTSSPTHPSFTQSLHIQQPATSLPKSTEFSVSNITPPTYDLMRTRDLSEPNHLQTAILKSDYNHLAVFITKESENSVDVISRMLNESDVPVQETFTFFNNLWDHMEHFPQYAGLKDVVLYILFNLYEFLLKENCRNDAAYLLTMRFSNCKQQFLHFKTFLPSGQCSPMQKCHNAVKLLLTEKLLTACYDWFILDEYQNETLSADINDKAFKNEKNNFIEEFLKLSYRDLNLAFNLISFCLDKNIGNCKNPYNGILINMINSADHKERVIALKNRLYNEEYVYLSSQTLRSYIVEFYGHLNFDEISFIYNIITKEGVYPQLTGHENTIKLRETLKEAEITLILTVFLERIVRNRILVAWNVKIQFHTQPVEPVTKFNSTVQVYARNLLMISTISEACKRLDSVLRSCSAVQCQGKSKDSKWHVCYTSGVVTLFSNYVQELVKYFKGTQTFM